MKIVIRNLELGIILSILLFMPVISQTYQPTKQKLVYKTKEMFIDTNQDFKQNKFTLGWHWANGFKMSQALSINEIMAYGGGSYDYNGNRVPYLHPDSTPRMAHNTNLIISSPYIGYTWSVNSMYRDTIGSTDTLHPLIAHTNGFWSVSHNIAFQYEPTYRVNLAAPAENWEPRQFDTTGYAFGFGTVRGYISSIQNDPNYDRLQLFQDSLVNQAVLAEPWISNDLASIAQVERNEQQNIHILPDTVFNVYNDPVPVSWDTLISYDRLDSLMKRTPILRGEDWKGINFYLTINLRRLKSNDIAMNNDTILAIRMPYITLDSAGQRQRGSIRFDSIPSPVYTDTFHLPNKRGLVRKLLQRPMDSLGFPVSIDTIYITRNMLPRGNETERDITISAFFVCDGNVLQPPYGSLNNYGLKDYWGRDPFPYSGRLQTIDTLKIEVIYKGNSDIGIDFLKIETRASRELSMGYLDRGIIRKMQEDIDSLTSTRFRNDSIQLFRWYTVDEPSSRYWFSQHYMTKLIGRVFTFEGGSELTHNGGQAYPQYAYYTNPSINWFGTGGIGIWPSTVPFIPEVVIDDDTTTNKALGWLVENCYDCYPEWPSIPDSVKTMLLKTSHYETVMHYTKYFNFFKDSNISPVEYTNGINFNYGVLFSLERSDYNVYGPAHRDFLYDNRPWWGQTWIDQGYNFDRTNKLKSITNSGAIRVITGEEFRYFMYNIILYGAKGFVLDGEDEQSDRLKLHHGQGLVDRLNYNNDNAWTFLDREEIGGDFLSLTDTNEKFHRYIQIDTVARYLRIDSSRYYVGRRSMRREFKKISEYIRNNNTLLMRLKLQAAMSKGFRRFYTQDPKITPDTMMKQYIDIVNIKTRPLGRVDANGNPYYEQSSIDSGFYDITLLRDTSTSKLYLGILNKRTGPHIVLNTADAGGVRDSVVFLTTAELEDSIMVDSTKWEKYYFNRLGCREIRIPFNIEREPEDSYSGDYIIAKELGAEDTTLRNTSFWLNEKYHDWIDTVIKGNGSLVSNYLPGEGKMIKLDFHNLAESSSAGDTCTGCYWASQHISIEKTARTDSNGQYCWDIIIHNSSDCDYDSLNILLLSNKNNIDSMTFSD
ncbi:MAG: hypothetical protein ABFD00_01155, partial [Chloroherpetonaceae bacterium]